MRLAERRRERQPPAERSLAPLALDAARLVALLSEIRPVGFLVGGQA